MIDAVIFTNYSDTETPVRISTIDGHQHVGKIGAVDNNDEDGGFITVALTEVPTGSPYVTVVIAVDAITAIES
ncbi:hypothetical protein HQO38_13110 [Rhodococcus fascians]|jgi:hypothetical protein|uniref:Uncharacterized protein n=1 Tax=Rhodococcoides fascians TaxID=1828 RepID=A0A143QH63_RHOFA|nr:MULTISPECIES: hypothetical protein [Rhodococcus]MDP9638135.1 hypothetical protein [Rhodococcus cercidiphylli]OZD57078.1 hypothetical protein CH252_03310 [Rhodococcus sp. 06-1477-1B]AMY22261.1 hypothetical protein A3Q41_00943 [Rhodococcus fascians]AMY53759.1 hypothetical protein A3L23_02422 [Rhodococcus fascians D188]KJV02474.1 hypothetical protein VF34_02288 [Rhodococcus sp. PML026]